MAALITTDFDIPAEISAGIFKKAQSGSTLAQLSGARPQKFGKQQAWILTAAPKAELVGEAAAKSPTPATYAPKVINPIKLQVTMRFSQEVQWADEDVQIGVLQDLADNAGIAMDPSLSFGLSTMRDKEGRKLYPELGFGQNVTNFAGMSAAISDTVSAKNEIATASKLPGIVGQFDAFRWGVQRSIGAHLIEYGDPDGLGDLQRQNQIAIRAEIVYGIGIMDTKAFVKINGGE